MAEKSYSDPLVPTVVAFEQCMPLPDTESRLSSTKIRIRTLSKWSLRLLLIPLWPLFYTGLYILIVYYARKAEGSNILDSPYAVNPKVISYVWFIVSAFVLDLNRFSLIGVEAVGVTSKRLAPVNAVKLLWHADWSWSTLTSFVTLVSTTGKAAIQNQHRQESSISRVLPGALWRILLLANVFLWIGVPLSGLSFNLGSTWTLTHERALIKGVNDTTFDAREWPLVLNSATSRWTQGLATTPEPPNMLYFPAGLGETIAETFFNDKINHYQNGQWIEYFVAPVVSDRVNGTAWGLLVNVSARLAHPKRDLKLLDVDGYTSYRNLTSTWGYVKSGPLYKCNYAILAATETPKSDASYSSLPGNDSTAASMHKGILEMAAWQFYDDQSAAPDPSMVEMANSTSVVVSQPLPSGVDSNPDILSYGLSVQIHSTTGWAALSARSRTFSNFTPSASSRDLQPGYNVSTVPDCENFTQFGPNMSEDLLVQEMRCKRQLDKLEGFVLGRGIPLIEHLLLSALTCENVMSASVNTTCIDAWYAANLATGGTLYLPAGATDVQITAITPERMRLALLKFVGEVSIAMMGPGPQTFEGDLTVVKQVPGILLGVVSWKLVLALLVAWAVLLCGLTVWALCTPRYIDKLDGYQWFKIGAVWAPELLDGGMDGEEARRHRGDDPKFQFYSPLQEIPNAAEARDAREIGLHGFAGVSLLRRRWKSG